MTTVAVTGAAGFLGSAVCRQVIVSGDEPRRIVHRATSTPDAVVADTDNAEALKRAMAGARCVIHCAGLAHQFGPTPDENFFRVNERGTANAIAAAANAGARRFVLASSVSVYGHGDSPDEFSDCTPRTPYARSKRAGELAGERVAADAGVELVILRLATLYGPGDRGNIGRLMRAVDSRRFIWIGDGSNRKSLLYVDDAARACVAAAAAGAPSGIFNVSGEIVTVHDIVDAMGRSLGRSTPRAHMPAALAHMAASIASRVPFGPLSRAGDTILKWLNDDVYAGAKFKESFGFVPSTPLADGIALQAQAYRGQRKS